jgi:hypothetical protein
MGNEPLDTNSRNFLELNSCQLVQFVSGLSGNI